MYIHARAPDEIVKKYPELQVVSEEPEWLAAHPIKETMTFDVNEQPKGWLAALVQERNK